MKFWLLSILLFPGLCYAEASNKRNTIAKTEIGLNIGHAPDNSYDNEGPEFQGGYLRGAVSFLRNKGRLNYGVTVEGGTNSNDDWYLSPGLLANYRKGVGARYIYAGAMVGYVCSQPMMSWMPGDEKWFKHGIVCGLQSGFALPISKRLSFSSELAIRMTRSWGKYIAYDSNGPRTLTETVIYIPITIGLRYQIKN